MEGQKSDFYNDYQEVSIWNPTYIKKSVSVRKPWYKYILGTMSDFHIGKYPWIILQVLSENMF